MYGGECGDGVCAGSEPVVERPGGDQRPLHLDAELLRHVPERRQLAAAAVRDAAEVALVEHVLPVEQCEHLEQQRREERVEHGVEVQLAAAVVGAQVVEQLREHLRVLLVQDAVRAREHVVQLTARTVDQLQTQACGHTRRLSLPAIPPASLHRVPVGVKAGMSPPPVPGGRHITLWDSEMDNGTFFFTQPTHHIPRLREMQTTVL